MLPEKLGRRTAFNDVYPPVAAPEATRARAKRAGRLEEARAWSAGKGTETTAERRVEEDYAPESDTLRRRDLAGRAGPAGARQVAG